MQENSNESKNTNIRATILEILQQDVLDAALNYASGKALNSLLKAVARYKYAMAVHKKINRIAA